MAAAVVRVAVLGPLEARDAEGAPVEVSGRRLRVLLTRLALDAGRVVSAASLIDDVWDEEPPAGAANALQSLVSRLRGLLGRELFESTAGGYRLVLDPDALDLSLFERGVRDGRAALARGDQALGARLLREALDLWRGPALADAAQAPFAAAAVARLEELRLTAVEDRFEAELALGAATRLIPELEALRAAHPLRERPYGQLMRALAASGRPAEALDLYEELRGRLADRLGADPSPALGAIHLAILRGEAVAPPAVAAGNDTSAGNHSSDQTLGRDAREGRERASSAQDASAAGSGRPGPLGVRFPSPAGVAQSGTRPLAGGDEFSSPRALDTAGPDSSNGALPTAAPSAPAFAAWISSVPADDSRGPAPGPGPSSAQAPAAGTPSAAVLGPASVAPTLGKLPAQLTSFVGREAEIELLSRRFGAARLITLTGPGGAGKTRLAVEAAAAFAATLRDGVWFVPLAPVGDAIDVPQAVLEALGVPEAGWRGVLPKDRRDPAGPLERLAAALSERELLLILDNCEHVIDAVARLADRVLAAAPRVRVLATSREPLALTGENLCPVSCLALPPEDADAATAAEYASVRLFTERAQAVRPDFRVDGENAAAVVQICRALDGVPLAIELAAARLRSLSTVQIAERLDDRFQLLSQGSRAALPRHQTLRAIVDWSWELLSAEERTVLRRLSVFAGGATPEAALRVCGPRVYAHAAGYARVGGAAAPAPTSATAHADAREPAAAPADVCGPGAALIDVIASLVDKSLVVADEDGTVRYRLLETVRAYAGERLAEAGEEEAVRDAHAAYFLELAETAEPHLRRADQIGWAARLTTERGNCNAALRHAIDRPDVPTALRFTRALTWFWLMRDYELEGGQWAVEVFAAAGAAPPPGLAEAYELCRLAAHITGAAREEHGDLAATGAVLQTAAAAVSEPVHPILALAPLVGAVLAGQEQRAREAAQRMAAEHSDPWVRAAALTVCGMLDLAAARPDSGDQLLLAAYEGFHALGDRMGQVFSLMFRVESALARGSYPQALSFAEEAYRHAADERHPGATVLIVRGKARAWAGDVEGGRAELERGVLSAERAGEYGDAAGGLAELASLALRLGDREAARGYVDHALRIVEGREGRPDVAQALCSLFCRRGRLAALAGRHEEAAGHYARAFEALKSGMVPPFATTGVGEIVLGLAELAGLRGEPVRAAELLGRAHAVYGLEYQANPSGHETRRAARAALGAEAYEAAFERGRRQSRDRVLALEA